VITVERVEAALLWVLILGLGFSITLAEVTLGLLALCWVARLREPGRRRSLPFPLLAPCVALACATVLAALTSARPRGSLAVSKNLLLLATLIRRCRSSSNAGPSGCSPGSGSSRASSSQAVEPWPGSPPSRSGSARSSWAA
jgi:hypothetical protein